MRAAASTGDTIVSELLLTVDGGETVYPDSAQISPRRHRRGEFFHPGNAGMELSSMDLSAPAYKAPHLDGHWGRFGPVPEPTWSWRRINQGVRCPPGRATLQIPGGTRHPAAHVLVAQSAPGNARNLQPFAPSPRTAVSPYEANLCLVTVRRIPSKTVGQALPPSWEGEG